VVFIFSSFVNQFLPPDWPLTPADWSVCVDFFFDNLLATWTCEWRYVFIISQEDFRYFSQHHKENKKKSTHKIKSVYEYEASTDYQSLNGWKCDSPFIVVRAILLVLIAAVATAAVAAAG
jgi:hypothetical protein